MVVFNRKVLISTAAFFLLGAVRSGLASERGAGWLKEASAQVLTPKSDRVAPVCVTRQEGHVAFLRQKGMPVAKVNQQRKSP